MGVGGSKLENLNIYLKREFKDGKDVAKFGPLKVENNQIILGPEIHVLLHLDSARRLSIFGLEFLLSDCYDSQNHVLTLTKDISSQISRSPEKDVNLIALPCMDRLSTVDKPENKPYIVFSAFVCDESLRLHANSVVTDSEPRNPADSTNNASIVNAINKQTHTSPGGREGSADLVYYQCFNGNGMLWPFGIFYHKDMNTIAIEFAEFPSSVQFLVSRTPMYSENKEKTSGMCLSSLNSVYEYALSINLIELITTIQHSIVENINDASQEKPNIILTGVAMGGCVAQCIYNRYFTRDIRNKIFFGNDKNGGDEPDSESDNDGNNTNGYNSNGINNNNNYSVNTNTSPGVKTIKLRKTYKEDYPWKKLMCITYDTPPHFFCRNNISQQPIYYRNPVGDSKLNDKKDNTSNNDDVNINIINNELGYVISLFYMILLITKSSNYLRVDNKTESETVGHIIRYINHLKSSRLTEVARQLKEHNTNNTTQLENDFKALKDEGIVATEVTNLTWASRTLAKFANILKRSNNYIHLIFDSLVDNDVLDISTSCISLLTGTDNEKVIPTNTMFEAITRAKPNGMRYEWCEFLKMNTSNALQIQVSKYRSIFNQYIMKIEFTGPFSKLILIPDEQIISLNMYAQRYAVSVAKKYIDWNINISPVTLMKTMEDGQLAPIAATVCAPVGKPEQNGVTLACSVFKSSLDGNDAKTVDKDENNHDYYNTLVVNLIFGKVLLKIPAETLANENIELISSRSSVYNCSDTRIFHRALATFALGCEFSKEDKSEIAECIRETDRNIFVTLGKLFNYAQEYNRPMTLETAFHNLESLDTMFDKNLPLKYSKLDSELIKGNSSVLYDLLHFFINIIDVTINGKDSMYSIVDSKNELIWSKEETALKESLIPLGSITTKSNLELRPAGVLAPISSFVDPTPFSEYRNKLISELAGLFGSNVESLAPSVSMKSNMELEEDIFKEVEKNSANTEIRFSPSLFIRMILQIRELRKLTFYIKDMKRINLGIIGTQNSGKSTWIQMLLKKRGITDVSTHASVINRTELVEPYILPCRDIKGSSGESAQYLPVIYDFPGCSDERKQTRKLFTRFLPICDACVVVVDVAHLGDIEHSLIERIRLVGIPFIILLNKCDLIPSNSPSEGETTTTINESAPTTTENQNNNNNNNNNNTSNNELNPELYINDLTSTMEELHTPLDLSKNENIRLVLSNSLAHLLGVNDNPSGQQMFAVSATDPKCLEVVNEAINRVLDSLAM